MKANEAPEKIYVSNYSSGLTYNWHNERLAVNDIEYTRTDVFIEKACEFLKSYRQDICDGLGYIAGVANDETIEDFKKYMEL
jgi:hypothetical protein